MTTNHHQSIKNLSTLLFVFVFPFLVFASKNVYDCSPLRDAKASTILVNNPFRITYPAKNFDTWYIGFNYTVTWEQGDNNSPAELAENVDIKLSLDDGMTFPITLASDVPNDGSHEVIIPLVYTSGAKISVTGVSGSFRAISDGSLSITQPIWYSTGGSNKRNVCDSTKTTTFKIAINSAASDTITVNLSILSKPQLLAVSLSKSIIKKEEESLISVSNIDSLPYGKYKISILAISPYKVDTLDLTIFKSSSTNEFPTIVSPLNGTTEFADTLLRWRAIPGIERYYVEVSDITRVSSPQLRITVSDTFVDFRNYIFPLPDLYYWRITPVSSCTSVSTKAPLNSFSTRKNQINIISIRPIIVDVKKQEFFNKSNLNIANAVHKDFSLILRKLPKYGSLLLNNKVLELYDQIDYSTLNNYSLSYLNTVNTDSDEIVFDIISEKLNSSQLVTVPIYIRSSNFNAFAFITKPLNCPEDKFGDISVFAYSGKPPYTYQLNGAMTNGGGSFSNLTAGEYTISVIDADGAVKTINITLPEPPSFIANPILDKYQLLPNVSGDLSQYKIELNNAIFSFQYRDTSIYLQNNGIYSLSITNDRGCNVTKTFILDVPPLEATLEQLTKAICREDSIQAKVLIKGGIPPYTTYPGFGFYQDSIVFIQYGREYFIVRDAGGKQFNIGPITYPYLAPINLAFSLKKSVLTMTASGGKAPYSYSFDGINYSATDTLQITSAGTIIVYLRDANGCEKTKSFFIRSLQESQHTVKNISCHNAQDGMVELIATDGLAPYLFSFNNSPYSDKRIFEKLTAGTYTYKIKDSYNDSLLGSVTIINPDKLELDLNIDGTIATAIVRGGTKPYRFSKDGGIQYLTTNNVFKNLENGTFTVFVKDRNGCVDSLSVIINSTKDISNSELQIFPNPTTDVLYLDFSSVLTSKITTKVVTVEGKEMNIAVKNENSKLIINTQTLTPGFYILEVLLDEKVIRKSFVKQ